MLEAAREWRVGDSVEEGKNTGSQEDEFGDRGKKHKPEKEKTLKR